MGISHEEIDSMCVMDNSAFSEDEGEFRISSVLKILIFMSAVVSVVILNVIFMIFQVK